MRPSFVDKVSCPAIIDVAGLLQTIWQTYLLEFLGATTELIDFLWLHSILVGVKLAQTRG